MGAFVQETMVLRSTLGQYVVIIDGMVVSLSLTSEKVFVIGCVACDAIIG